LTPAHLAELTQAVADLKKAPRGPSFAEYRDYLEADERFRGSIVVAPQDPQLAAAEIARAGDRPGVVQVFLPLKGVLMGDRHYYPIYEAAAERGLPIAVHPNSADGVFVNAPAIAGGVATYYAEWHTSLSQIFQANVVSLVCHGVFERFPGLSVVVTEGGFAWLADVMWRLDKDWRSVRDEVPWVKRLPSEHLRDSVRIATQPLGDITARQFEQLVELVDAEHMFMFSTDYPHYDSDSADAVVSKALPEDLRRRVRFENAVGTYPRLSLT